MAQIFRPQANHYAVYSIVGGLALIGSVAFVVVQYNWSPWKTRAEVPLAQPVPFSHAHHVSDLGIDCRYCHTSVEVSASAGMPSTHTCMSCHAQLWTESDVLKPVRASFRTGRPIPWLRVHDLPDYVYFNHSIHVNKGVGCETCHGRVDQMPLTYKAHVLTMAWCLDCHRRPERYLRPPDMIYAFGYDPPAAVQHTRGRQLLDSYHIDPAVLTNCSVCHR